MVEKRGGFAQDSPRPSSKRVVYVDHLCANVDIHRNRERMRGFLNHPGLEAVDASCVIRCGKHCQMPMQRPTMRCMTTVPTLDRLQRTLMFRTSHDRTSWTS